MNLVDRVKNILLAPKAEWPKIDAETATPQSIFTGYVLILAAIHPILTIVVSLGHAIVPAIVQYVVGLLITFVIAFIADALAPSFGGTKNFVKSLQLVAYSWTGVWIAAGIAALIPILGGLLMIAALIYAFYTFYLGAPVLGRASTEKAAGYTIVILLCGIALGVILGAVLMPFMFGVSMMSGMGRMWI
jgi:hypothetical protein